METQKLNKYQIILIEQWNVG